MRKTLAGLFLVLMATTLFVGGRRAVTEALQTVQGASADTVTPSLNLTHTTSFVVFPGDCNANPPMVFGGKLLAEMDRCAGITTRRLLYASPTGARDAVTVAIQNLTFRKGGEVKDLLFVTGIVVDLGAKSVKVRVKVEREVESKREMLVDGEFVFVAFDLASKKTIEHGLSLPPKS